ncbi:uncharacterized protein PFL1_03583 [Pseudozyma flocculosa PF-1]|uniref:Related to magnesium-dependent acid phosphatase n=2 Tax=Pseudozyma flocculosa TaxID=84751 RepID=A0A5C3F6L8_9BASI|nr:uncharacterized protein PFL1_03583 [Pseudozyma flocculosa PF-1]EPQ28780.1 hypothetical protein PFL1_03583 [Pseudozyma flocculosa PF-1]SPO39435.1 related to magnesium-dependent acid phosphatase [Pseudozyma flocculosa]
MVKRRHQKNSSNASSAGAAAANDDEVASNYGFDGWVPGVVESLERIGSPLPKLVVFDLDYTLWPLWVDTHVDPPLKRKGNAINRVVDRHGQPLSFFPHVPHILLYLKRHGVEIAAASRTCAPPAARQALNGLFLVDDAEFVPTPADSEDETEQETGRKARKASASVTPRRLIKAISLFDHLEIYPGSKIAHFRELHKESGIDYEDHLFFDDESRNAEVGTKLGVHFVEVGHQGLDLATFERGVREWRAKKLVRAKQRGDVDDDEDVVKESGLV